MNFAAFGTLIGHSPLGNLGFCQMGAHYEVYNYLERTPSPDPRDRDLLDGVQFFIAELDHAIIAELLGDLTGQASPAWTLDDFALNRTGRPPTRPVAIHESFEHPRSIVYIAFWTRWRSGTGRANTSAQCTSSEATAAASIGELGFVSEYVHRGLTGELSQQAQAP